MTIHIYPVPLAEFEQRLGDLKRFGWGTDTSPEGLHILLRFHTDADRIAAALVLGEAAKPYRSSLLICADRDDEEITEQVRFVTEELQLRCSAYRFLWVLADTLEEAAVARALMPLGPIRDDPRGLWEKLP